VLIFTSLPLQRSFQAVADIEDFMDWSGSGSGNGSGSGFGNFTSTADYTCLAESIKGNAYNFTHSLALTARIALIVYYAILLLVSAPLNVFMIILILKCKNLRSISFALILQVLFINLLSSVLLTSLVITTVSADKWLLGAIMCIITGVLNYTIMFIRTEIMFCFVIDRFLLVFVPFAYPKHRQKVVLALSIASYVVPVVLSVIPAFLGCYAFVPSTGLCDMAFNCGLVCTVYRIVVTCVVVFPSCLIPLLLYACLLCKAKRLEANTGPASIGLPNPDPSREGRATMTLFLMFVALFAITAPHAVISVIGSLIFIRGSPSLWYMIAEGIFISVISLVLILDPIVLSRNTDVRDEITKLWPWLPRLWC
jgi:hypothetical protein